MKLFQWVHRKLQQNDNDPFKDVKLGNPCACLTLDSQYSQTKQSFSSINQLCFLKSHHQESQTSWCREEDKSQEETSAVISELFEGFLTIGTLGAEAVINEPATPTFATPSENIPMKDADMTENELKHISYELEKFLETEEESFKESSGRNSRLSLSNIKISGKQTDGSEDEDCGNKDVCPLQGYLFGSSFEIPEKVQVRKERASLAELFRRTKTANEDCIETGVKDTQVKQAQKSPMHIMKKMLKMVHISSKSCNTSEKITDSTTTNKKLSKVLRKFHRKVYPDDTINAKSVAKSHKSKIKNLPRECFDEHCQINWNPPQDDLCCSGLTGNNEHWIRTDADYLVLEL